jgi:Flp pilus assembly protein TadB
MLSGEKALLCAWRAKSKKIKSRVKLWKHQKKKIRAKLVTRLGVQVQLDDGEKALCDWWGSTRNLVRRSPEKVCVCVCVCVCVFVCVCVCVHIYIYMYVYISISMYILYICTPLASARP